MKAATPGSSGMRVLRACVLSALAAAALPSSAAGQQPGGGGPPKQPPTARASAPIDLTGVWVSVVSEDWRWRMVVPQKGDYSSVPLSPEGRKVADMWTPANRATDGCRPFGAAAVMRMPGRIRVSWDGERTLKIETDAGAQTRLLRFDPPAGARTPASWQGTSVAEWEQILSPGGLGVSLQTAPPRVGTLKVTTTNLRAGYLRRNGVPYSEDTTITEYFDRVTAAGSEWLTVYTVVQDPRYLSQPFITSTHFKREPDASKWLPAPCEGR